ncbi:pilus assembly protein [Zhongshania sp.]|uniref:pilus assembly protein n=2 Tax=Zhongshania sp. TaxID=1971902 RepID=UPI0035682070
MSTMKKQIAPQLLQGAIVAGFIALCTVLPMRANAGDCLINATTPTYIGIRKQNVSYTFTGLSEIKKIVSYVLDPSDAKGLCLPTDIWFSGNIVTVSNNASGVNQCKAKVTVQGLEKGCTPDTPPVEGVAQVPLFLTQSINPNIMYILDDSGSMMRELMPDSLRLGGTDYIYPRANGVYGSDDKHNYVPTVDDNSPYNARSRSAYINKVYYDPSTTYQVWKKADGSSFPPANPSCALHNPMNTTLLFDQAKCRNLTVSNSNYNSTTWVDCTSAGACTNSTATKNFWPATYFWYKGAGSDWNWASYQKVEIRFGQTFTGHGREARSDCVASALGVCTYTEELQNFANWYTYYRSRVLTARAGTGLAFAEQSGGMRVGFATINKGSGDIDGVNTPVIINGVREFSGSDRSGFFSSLYGTAIPNANTPLRYALDSVGQYYSRTDTKGPWSGSPGIQGEQTAGWGRFKNGEQLACRRNYALLMTDGYWNSTAASGDRAGNNDGTANPTHTSPSGQSYTYKAVSPFTDSWSSTLADVAMYYWKNDLRSDYLNLVPVTKGNPAFWQHMVTYGIGFGVSGKVDPKTAFDAIASGATISWPDPASDDLNKIDDLLHAGVNSRGGFFSASEPATFATELSTVLRAISAENKSSAAAIAASSTKLDSATIIYQASFNSLDWSGKIVAHKLNSDGSVGDVAWDTDKNAVPDISARNVIVGIGLPDSLVSTALPLNTANYSLLSAGLQVALAAGGTATDALDRLAWIRGDKSKEGTKFRVRGGPLGDIVNSNPFYADKKADYGFAILSGTEGDKYTAFLETKKSWPNTLHVGANDAMFHVFNAETGKELMSYIPVSAYSKLADLTLPDYVHKYSVDGSPRGSDAYINGAWRTVVVGSTGAGGKSVFAINASSPASMSKSNFMWEFATGPLSTDKLGIAMSEPVIARLEAENKWVAIFGNGYESGDNVKLFVVDLATGALLKAIDTGITGVGNGLATPVPVDVDNDRITDYVYAGDLKGNMWKFDFTGSTIASWSVAFKANNGVSDVPKPLFTATDASGTPQPITMRATVGSHDESGYMVYFGTGKYFEYSDAILGSSPQIQHFYGIRDNDAPITDRTLLVSQTVIYEDDGVLSDGTSTEFKVRVVSNNSANTPPAYGWRLKLLPPGRTDSEGTGERAVSTPILRNGRIIFASIIPSDNVCGYGGSSWLMEVNADNGGRFTAPTLDANDDGVVDNLDMILIDGEYYPISGRRTGEMIKTPAIVSGDGVEFKYTSGSSGSLRVIAESEGDTELLGRQSWRQFQ